MENKIKVFESKQVRTLWNAEEEEWYFAVVDIVDVLTDSKDPNAYWRKLSLFENAGGGRQNAHD